MEDFELITQNEAQELGIVSIVDNSNAMLKRAYITFKNGYRLSVIRGRNSYGGDQGLFEIAPFDKNGNMDGGILGIIGDDVEGYLSASAVIDRIKAIAAL